MKAKHLKELLSHIGDDEEVYIAADAHDYWPNIHVSPVRRVEAETAVWDANGQSYRLLKDGQSVADYEDTKHPCLHVVVLK